MWSICINLKPIAGDRVELRYFFDNPNQYQPRSLELKEIKELIRHAELYYYMLPEDFAKTGQKLYDWLDGSDRTLARAMNQYPGEDIILAIAALEKLAHLPWEVLHDGNSFLVARMPAVVSVRWVSSNTVNKLSVEAEPENRALQILFMATSPVGQSVLDFEAEEGRILEATAKKPKTISLTVEESGYLPELSNLITLYDKGYFDVFHLTGHATLTEQGSRFITETETGKAYLASAQEIAKALKLRLPKLIFLSGCLTGKAGNSGAMPSMAQELIKSGAKAVLSWGQRVSDSDATTAAAALYQSLSEGYALTEAVALTYQALIENQARDWHLLRLYTAGTLPGELVKPSKTPAWKPAPPPSTTTQFLDSAGKVKVPTRESFVGRRRQLQNCLRALTQPTTEVGVLIHGMRGLGKSSVAARLCDRLRFSHKYDKPIVWSKQIDEQNLVNSLVDSLDNHALREILQATHPPLKYRLQEVFAQTGKQFLLVFDDFEANLEAREGGFVLSEQAVEVLQALVFAIRENDTNHRLILTSRYDFESTQLQYFYKQPLDALQGADLRKKCNRLTAFSSTQIDELKLQAKKLADGNPLLLEELDSLLQVEQVVQARILEQMAGKVTKFRVDIQVEELLQQQSLDLRRMLGWSLVYELPVPKAAITAICSSLSKLDNHINRAVALGLLEVSNIQGEPHYRVSRILEPLLLPFRSDSKQLYITAAEFLYELWAEAAFVKIERGEAGNAEDRILEIHRLAQRGKLGHIVFGTGQPLAVRWHKQGRLKDAIWLCYSILEVVKDYRTFHTLALVEEKLGDMDNCIQHYQAALKLCPLEDKTERYNIIHDLAYFLIDQERINQALILNQQLLQLGECSSNLEIKASALHQLGYIKTEQGQPKSALKHYKQALKLRRQIGCDRGIAVTLNNIALIYVEQGSIDVEINLFKEIFEPFERSGEIEEMIAILNNLSIILNKQKQFDQVIDLLQPIFERYKHTNHIKHLAGIIQNQATAFAELEKFEEAIALYHEALELNQERYPDMQAVALFEIGIVHIKQRKFPQALSRIKEALEIWQQLSSPKVDNAKAMIATVEQMAKS